MMAEWAGWRISTSLMIPADPQYGVSMSIDCLRLILDTGRRSMRRSRAAGMKTGALQDAPGFVPPE